MLKNPKIWLKHVTYKMFLASNGHARSRPSTVRHLQLSVARTAGAPGSSTTCDSRHGRSGTREYVPEVRCHVCHDGPAVDSAREVAAGATDPDVVLGAQR